MSMKDEVAIGLDTSGFTDEEFLDLISSLESLGVVGDYESSSSSKVLCVAVYCNNTEVESENEAVYHLYRGLSYAEMSKDVCCLNNVELFLEEVEKCLVK